MSPRSSLSLARSGLLRTMAFIDGEWIEAGAGFAVIDPADGGVIARVAECGAEQARQAADAAAVAFAAWKLTTAHERSQFLAAWRDLMVRHEDDLARLISAETGKPLPESRNEIAYAASYVEWFAEEAKRGGGEVIPAPHPGRRMTAVREPVGVAALVTPWNFPAAMVTRKCAPALAAGCTALLKPAEDTPLTALALAVLAQEAGAPPGVLNVVPTSRAGAAKVIQVWLDDPRVRKLSFTGSTPVGRILARESARTLKRVSMELGGDAPFLVFEDADLDIAVQALIAAKFRNAGQACIAANRVLAADTVHDAFVERLLETVTRLRVGPPSDPAADIGPLINDRAVERLERFIGQAVERGARILAGGTRSPHGERFFEPTVLVDAPADLCGACEELFGPVILLGRFADEAEAVRLGNQTPTGLAAYVCTRDLGRAHRVADALEAGIVGVNEGAVSAAAAPFGGVKESGYGREGSIYGLSEYQSLKYICIGGLDQVDTGLRSAT